MTTLVAIGNPGAGKSTILNCVAGKVLFRSGISIGDGLTFQLDKQCDDKGNVYVDTPGISDNKHRKKAGEDISKLLKEGGRLKIIMFIREFDGRVVVEDITTMQMVLEAAPEIGSDFGIIVNKIGAGTMRRLADTQSAVKFLSSALFGLERFIENFKPENIKYLFLQRTEMLDQGDDLLVPREDLRKQLPGLIEFLLNLPTASLTQGKSTDLNTDRFDAILEKYNDLFKEFAKKKDETDQRIAELTEKLEAQQSVYGKAGFFKELGSAIDDKIENCTIC